MATYATVPPHDGNDNEKVAGPAPASHPHHEHHMSDFIPGAHHEPHHRHFHLPRGIHEDGESGRRGLTPHFFKIVLRSSCVPSALCNILWPFVPLAIVWTFDKNLKNSEGAAHYAIVAFTLNYLAMIPSANLLGFAGQELARKLPKVFGVLLETFLGGLVEIVLFIILIVQSPHEEIAGENSLAYMEATEGSEAAAAGEKMKRAEGAGSIQPSLIPVIQAAILGSVLANLLLCLGICFIAGGIRHSAQKFSKDISETGSGLLLIAAFALTIPRAFGSSLENADALDASMKELLINKISRAAGVILVVAFLIYVAFQMFSHHGIMSAIFEEDELRDKDRHRDLAKDKLTLTECIIAIIVALACVSCAAYGLVIQIEPIVHETGVSDMFIGLILVPLVEKFAEHLTTIDEAWDNTMNLALAHVLGATLQTVLFNTGLVVIVGWGLGKPMNLDFNPFHVIVVVLAILAVGSFLRDGESTYLEGSVCVLIYILIAVAAYYYPNSVSQVEILGLIEPGVTQSAAAYASIEATATGTGAEAAAAATEAAGEAVHKMMKMMMRT